MIMMGILLFLFIYLFIIALILSMLNIRTKSNGIYRFVSLPNYIALIFQVNHWL